MCTQKTRKYRAKIIYLQSRAKSWPFFGFFWFFFSNLAHLTAQSRLALFRNWGISKTADLSPTTVTRKTTINCLHELIKHEFRACNKFTVYIRYENADLIIEKSQTNKKLTWKRIIFGCLLTYLYKIELAQVPNKHFSRLKIIRT